MKSCCDLKYHYDDERNKTVFHNTTPDLQDEDRFLVSDRSCPKTDGLRPHIILTDPHLPIYCTTVVALRKSIQSKPRSQLNKYDLFLIRFLFEILNDATFCVKCNIRNSKSTDILWLFLFYGKRHSIRESTSCGKISTISTE